MKKIFIYIFFFAILFVAFYYFLFAGTDYYKSKLPVLNRVQQFSFVDQNGKRLTNKAIEGKVYATEYFFTTCKGICPKMNANMKKVYDAFADQENFAIISHTCMPETDSVPLLKKYEQHLLGGVSQKKAQWYFVTGNKDSLYRMARESYLLDNDKNNSLNISDQFIHTQFFAVIDKEQRVRGIYDALKTDDVEKLIGDIRKLLKESADPSSFNHSTFSNNPN